LVVGESSRKDLRMEVFGIESQERYNLNVF
jgi:hypothetical protein